MMNSYYISAVGMHAQQIQLDLISNNLANLNTPGFKKSTATFETLMMSNIDPMAQHRLLADPGKTNGAGVSNPRLALDFSSGTLKQTQRELDLAINGSGLFELQLPGGRVAYTRAGMFRVNSDGYLVNSSGHKLTDNIQLPSDVTALLVGADGRVQVQVGSLGEIVDIGSIQISHFANPAGLDEIGNSMYVATEASGLPILSVPGENGAGTISQGYLEGSNVEMISEVTNMMTAQRAYEANSRVLQASDKVMEIINSLKR